ncbi:MAG: lipoprotein NlpC precursor [Segetibacter sp.]|jgi:cell wall-associated NlpC family hydrolase|nr:lipoprotein NlpC precursor [Segetibacter sp.]
MNKTRLLYCLLSVVLLSSCSQWKAIRSRDNSTSAAKTPSKKSNAKKVRFLDNISVTPGEVVTSKHATVGPSMPSLEKRKKERESYNAVWRPAVNAGNIEKVDWLQLKYAIVLDATVETLNNLNLLTTIDDWWGTNYCYGGSTKDCIDCSAFTHVVMQNVYKVNIPRTAQEQYNARQQINLEDLNEGDLVFFHTSGPEISHVGVYLQNNKFVHAATSGGVMVSDLNDTYWKPRYKGAGRYNGVTTTTTLSLSK